MREENYELQELYQNEYARIANLYQLSKMSKEKTLENINKINVMAAEAHLNWKGPAEFLNIAPSGREAYPGNLFYGEAYDDDDDPDDDYDEGERY